MDTHQTIAFMGAGTMARAIIAGLIQNGFKADHIWATNPNAEKLDRLLSDFNIHTTTDNAEAVAHADVIVLAVKPDKIHSVCNEIKLAMREKKQLLISVAAGVTINTIKKWTDDDECHIVRAMPNIAAAIGASATGLVANASVTEEQVSFAESLFRAIGATVWLANENELNALTAISGSGPAYLFYMYEAMQRAGEALGLSSETAKFLVSQTAVGAAKMTVETNEDFDSLRGFITSPNGTTQAAIEVLASYDVNTIIAKAIDAAFERAKTLSEENT